MSQASTGCLVNLNNRGISQAMLTVLLAQESPGICRDQLTRVHSSMLFPCTKVAVWGAICPALQEWPIICRIKLLQVQAAIFQCSALNRTTNDQPRADTSAEFLCGRLLACEGPLTAWLLTCAKNTMYIMRVHACCTAQSLDLAVHHLTEQKVQQPAMAMSACRGRHQLQGC
jgi:hypothetical protein